MSLARNFSYFFRTLPNLNAHSRDTTLSLRGCSERGSSLKIWAALENHVRASFADTVQPNWSIAKGTSYRSKAGGFSQTSNSSSVGIVFLLAFACGVFDCCAAGGTRACFSPFFDSVVWFGGEGGFAPGGSLSIDMPVGVSRGMHPLTPLNSFNSIPNKPF